MSSRLVEEPAVHRDTLSPLSGKRVRVLRALQLHLSWIPGDYPGYEQWYYKCKPTCVFRVRPLPCHATRGRLYVSAWSEVT